jgi:hypothetical protein
MIELIMNTATAESSIGSQRESIGTIATIVLPPTSEYKC